MTAGPATVRAWFDQHGWQLDPAALRAALQERGADDDQVIDLIDEGAERRRNQPSPVAPPARNGARPTALTPPTQGLVPPQNLEAEENILGAMMLSPGAITAVSELLDASDFYRESHAKIYRAAVALHGKGEPVDAITLTDELEERSHLDDVGGRVRLHELAALVPASANAAHYARIVHETATLRGLIRAGGEIARLGWERPGETPDLLERARRILDDTTDPAAASHTPLEIVTLDTFTSVDEPGAHALVGDSEGGALIPENGDIMIYGDGGAGKTTLAADLACHLAAGTPWLGIPITTTARVLLIENEGPRPLFREKLRRKRDGWNGPPLEGRVTVLETPWATLSFAAPAWRHTLAGAVQQHQLDVVIVGPVTRAGMDEAGTLQEVRDFMSLIHDVRRRAERRVCFILIHHENKGGQVSGAWEGAGDTLLHVQGQGHGRTRLFIQKARWSTTLHSTSLNLLWADGESFTVETKPEFTDDDIADQILTTIKENAGARWRTIEQKTPGISTDRRRTLRDHLFKTRQIVNVAKLAGEHTILDNCPHGKPSSLYAADDPLLTQLNPSPDSVAIQYAPPSGVRGQPARPPARSSSAEGDEKAPHPAPEDLQWTN